MQFYFKITDFISFIFSEIFLHGLKFESPFTKKICSEYNEYTNEDPETDGFEREQRAKKESTDLIQKQFALRRNAQDEISKETLDKLLAQRSHVQAPSATSKKVKGLTLPTREMYWKKISEVLWDNYTKCGPEEREFDKRDVEDCGVEVEYSVFSTTTTLTMYRSTLARLVSFIFYLYGILYRFFKFTKENK